MQIAHGSELMCEHKITREGEISYFFSGGVVTYELAGDKNDD